MEFVRVLVGNCDEPMYAKFFLRGSETFNETFFGGHQLFLFRSSGEWVVIGAS
jgi:hypothetical protein